MIGERALPSRFDHVMILSKPVWGGSRSMRSDLGWIWDGGIRGWILPGSRHFFPNQPEAGASDGVRGRPRPNPLPADGSLRIPTAT
jgi:hypothetical protein